LENSSKRYLGKCKNAIIYNIINYPSYTYGCPLEDDIHYLLECPLYTNTRMKLFMNITPYAVISIETLLFNSDNLTDGYIYNKCIHKYIWWTKMVGKNGGDEIECKCMIASWVQSIISYHPHYRV
jgi:hypothetical protein